MFRLIRKLQSNNNLNIYEGFLSVFRFPPVERFSFYRVIMYILSLRFTSLITNGLTHYCYFIKQSYYRRVPRNMKHWDWNSVSLQNFAGNISQNPSSMFVLLFLFKIIFIECTAVDSDMETLQYMFNLKPKIYKFMKFSENNL